MGHKIWIVSTIIFVLIGSITLGDFIFNLLLTFIVEQYFFESLASLLGHFFGSILFPLIAFFSWREYNKNGSESDGMKKSVQWYVASLIAFSLFIISIDSWYFFIRYYQLYEGVDVLALTFGNDFLLIFLGACVFIFLALGYSAGKKEREGNPLMKKVVTVLPYEELKQLKQLLNMEAITQAEYDEKKRKTLEKI